MDSNRKTEYARKVVASTPLQLIIVNYEIIIECLSEAKLYLSNNDIEKFSETIDRTQKFLGELVLSLDMKYDISKQLYDIYIYINKLLITSKLKSTEKELMEADGILQNLLKSWVQIEKEDNTNSPDVNNSSKLFAGLTYNNKGQLDEYTEETGGYKA